MENYLDEALITKTTQLRSWASLSKPGEDLTIQKPEAKDKKKKHGTNFISKS